MGFVDCWPLASAETKHRENAARTGRLFRQKVRGPGTPPGAPKLHSPRGCAAEGALGNLERESGLATTAFGALPCSLPALALRCPPSNLDISRVPPGARGQPRRTIVIWLILPVVICLSQRLSHACLSISLFIRRDCGWLIKSVIVYLMVSFVFFYLLG